MYMEEYFFLNRYWGVYKMNEINIAETNNNTDDFFDLETLIAEGVDARVPIEVEFPNGKKAQALIKPISTGEFSTIYNGNAAELLINVLKHSLMNKNGELLNPSLIVAMPVGLPAKIVQQIFKISGIETNPDDAEKLKDELELFP